MWFFGPIGWWGERGGAKYHSYRLLKWQGFISRFIPLRLAIVLVQLSDDFYSAVRVVQQESGFPLLSPIWHSPSSTIDSYLSLFLWAPWAGRRPSHSFTVLNGGGSAAPAILWLDLENSERCDWRQLNRRTYPIKQETRDVPEGGIPEHFPSNSPL